MQLFTRYLTEALFLVLFFSVVLCRAQQDPMYTQYMNNPLSINPAYAGSSGMVSVTGLYRNQWAGLEGAPKTFSLSMNTPVRHYNTGLGFNLLYDQIGPAKQVGIYVDYAYHLSLSDEVSLSLGLKGGVNNYVIDLLALKISDYSDEYLTTYGNQNKVLPNIGVGLYAYAERWYAGVALPKLMQHSLSKRGGKEAHHLFGTAGAMIVFSDLLKFKPSFMTRWVKGAPLSFELSPSLLLHDQLWLGLMYRFENAVGVMIAFQLKSEVRIGYSFDYQTSSIKRAGGNTHELLLSYDIQRHKKKRLSPRYF